MNWCYSTIRWLAKKYFQCFYRLKVYGLGHIPPGGAIIAANHASFFDPPIVAISSPREIHFLARETLFKNFLFGSLIRTLNAHPVKGGASDAHLFRMVGHLLQEGKKVLLFPEGSRATEDKIETLKPGVAFLAIKYEVPIIPTYISGTFSIFNRFRKWPKPFGCISCTFGSPLSHTHYSNDRKALIEALYHKLCQLKKWHDSGANGIPP